MKRTGGGLFDSSNRHVYFGAGKVSNAVKHMPPFTLVPVTDIMESGSTHLTKRLDSGQIVLLDSGIFTITQQHMRAHPGVTMDQALALAPDAIDGFAELYERYCAVVSEYGEALWGYIELDQGGRENKIKTRAKLEKRGLRPIPVYHPLNDGWDYFDYLATRYDRICVGNMVNATSGLRARICATIWERHRAYPELWIHGLGYAANEMLHPWPFDSVDSTSWIAPLRWGLTRGQVPADMQPIGDLHGDYRYIAGHPGSLDKATGLASWSVVGLTEQWRAHRAELDALGVPALPGRFDGEPAPCPSV